MAKRVARRRQKAAPRRRRRQSGPLWSKWITNAFGAEGGDTLCPEGKKALQWAKGLEALGASPLQIWNAASEEWKSAVVEQEDDGASDRNEKCQNLRDVADHLETAVQDNAYEEGLTTKEQDTLKAIEKRLRQVAEELEGDADPSTDNTPILVVKGGTVVVGGWE